MWIDHRKAVVVIVSDEAEEVREITSHMDKHVRFRRGEYRMNQFPFMITFGLVSSVFDHLTFGVLLFVLHATQVQFRTGWFLESVVSASLIVLVITSKV